MLLYSASAARWKCTWRHRAEDFVTTSNTERSVSFPFCAKQKKYSSDLLSSVLQTPLCPAQDAWTERIPSGRARVYFVWRLSVRNVGVWLIFLTRSLKCLGEHFNVNNVFCCFYNIFCLFALSYQSDTQKCLPDNIHRVLQIQQNSSFSARNSRGVLSNANTEIVFHSRLAEIVKDVNKAEFLLLMLASLSSSNSTFEIIFLLFL